MISFGKNYMLKTSKHPVVVYYKLESQHLDCHLDTL